MAAKTSWHRYGTKLRHCHFTYTLHDNVILVFFMLYELSTVERKIVGEDKV